MRKKCVARLFIFLLVFSTVATLPLAAVDFGLTLDNTLGVSITETAGLHERLKASAWFTHSWLDSEAIEYRVSVIGIYVLTELRPYLFDFEELKFSIRNPGALAGTANSTLNLGRFVFSDQTGAILNHRSDGVESISDFGMVRTKFMLGYTGLQLNGESRIMLSPYDFSLVYKPEEVLGSKRIFVEAGLAFPELFLQQNLRVSALAQIDTYYIAPSHSVYATLGLDGPISSNFFYSFDGIFSYFPLEQADSAAGALFQAAFDIFLPRVLRSVLSLDLYAAIGSYRPLSLPTLGLIHLADPGTLSRVNLGYSIKPFEGNALFEELGFRAEARLFVDGQDGFFSTYDGLELELGADWKVSSDFGLGLSAGVYLPPLELGQVAEARMQLFVSLGL